MKKKKKEFEFTVFIIITFLISAFIDSLLSVWRCARIMKMNFICFLEKIALTIILFSTLDGHS